MSDEGEGRSEGSARGDAVPPRTSSASAGRLRIYSKRGEEKAYLRLDADAMRWVRSWRDATAFDRRGDAESTMTRARAAEPGRPMCIVMWGTRRADLGVPGQ